MGPKRSRTTRRRHSRRQVAAQRARTGWVLTLGIWRMYRGRYPWRAARHGR